MAEPAIKGPPYATILVRIAELRAWLFLIVLILFFEAWARLAYDASFVLNTYNLQSISVFATAPLLLALGQTFVIISADRTLAMTALRRVGRRLPSHSIVRRGSLCGTVQFALLGP
jgi:ribose transport system permease protein